VDVGVAPEGKNSCPELMADSMDLLLLLLPTIPMTIGLLLGFGIGRWSAWQPRCQQKDISVLHKLPGERTRLHIFGDCAHLEEKPTVKSILVCEDCLKRRKKMT
jgi:hypothetical protein